MRFANKKKIERGRAVHWALCDVDIICLQPREKKSIMRLRRQALHNNFRFVGFLSIDAVARVFGIAARNFYTILMQHGETSKSSSYAYRILEIVKREIRLVSFLIN